MITLHVYGAEELCASCIHLPSSRETASWLEAALKRKYGSDQIEVQYVDIDSPRRGKEQQIAQQVIEENLWYPVVVLEDEIIAEGDLKLKEITARLERLGLIALESSDG